MFAHVYRAGKKGLNGGRVQVLGSWGISRSGASSESVRIDPRPYCELDSELVSALEPLLTVHRSDPPTLQMCTPAACANR